MSPARLVVREAKAMGTVMAHSLRRVSPLPRAGGDWRYSRGTVPSPWRRNRSAKYSKDTKEPAVTPSSAAAAPSERVKNSACSWESGTRPSTVPRAAYSPWKKDTAHQAAARPRASFTAASNTWEKAVGTIFPRPS